MWKQIPTTEYYVNDRNQFRRKYRDRRIIKTHGPFQYITGSVNS